MIGLSRLENLPIFLMIENCIDIEEQFWLHDYYNYVYKGCCIALSALLKIYNVEMVIGNALNVTARTRHRHG